MSGKSNLLGAATHLASGVWENLHLNTTVFLFGGSETDCLQRPALEIIKSTGNADIGLMGSGIGIYCWELEINALGRWFLSQLCVARQWHFLPSFVVSSWALWYFEFIHKPRILHMWFIEDLSFLWLFLRRFSCPSVVESKLAMQSGNSGGERWASDL